MLRLIDWGVDDLISDRPDFLREAMTEKNLPLPKPRRSLPSLIPLRIAH